MANRFDKTYDQQPWVSSYVPLPLKDIELGYKEQQKKYDDAMAAVANEPVITGGNSTKTVAQGLENEKNNFLKSVVDEAVETKDYGQVKNKIKAYRNQLEANPYYQGILIDKTLSPAADATIVGDKDRQVAQDFYDYDKGEYNQVTDKPFTADHYAAMAPPDTQKIFSQYYKDIGDVIEQQINPDGSLEKQFNPDGSISYIQNGTKIVRNVTRDELRKIAAPLMNDASFRALAPFGYNKLRHKQLFGKDILDANGNVIERGSQWDEYNDPLDIFVDNYLKTKREETETQKLLYTTKVPKDDTSGGGGDGGTRKQPGEIDNPTLNIVREAHDTGGAMVNGDQAAAIIGGTSDKNGHVTINATGRKLYLNVGNAGNTPEQVEENALIGRTIPYRVKLKNITGDIDGTDSDDLPAKLITTLEKNDPSHNYFSGQGGVILMSNKDGSNQLQIGDAKKVWNDYKDKTITSKRLDDKGNTVITEIPMFPEYAALKKAAEADGVDLDDKNINAKIDKIVDAESLSTMNSMLDNIKGEITFIPGSGKNFTGDDIGNSLLSGDVFVTEEQMKDMSPDNFWLPKGGYETLESKELIYPHTLHKTNAQGEDIAVKGYGFHITTPVMGQNTENAVRNVTSNMAGGYHQWVAGVVPQQTREVNNQLYLYKLEKKANKFQKQFEANPDQTITNFDKDYNDIMSGKYVDSQTGKRVSPPGQKEQTELNLAKVKVLEDQKMSKADKARVLFQIKLRLTDPDAYNIMYPSGSQGGESSMGKQSTQQDNSNPLGM
jgi:hypothetical protein